MNFESAIKKLKEGKKVRRKSWNGLIQYIELATNIKYKNLLNETINIDQVYLESKGIAFVKKTEVQLGWVASQEDILANDWVIKSDNEDKKKVKCPYCSKEVWIEFDCMHNDYIDNIETVTYTGFCNNCGGFISRFIDKNKKEFIGKYEFYKAHPEKYDLKKYMWFLLERLELIKASCKKFLENNKTLSKEIKDLIEYCCNVATLTTSDNGDDRLDFFIELAQDLLDEKYEIIIKKKLQSGRI